MKLPIPQLSPFVRRLLGALSLGAGVLVVGSTLRSTAPRDVEVRVPLGAFQGISTPVRALDLTFSRRGSALRTIHRNISATPRVWRETVTLPEGAMDVRVSVTLDHRIVERETLVSITPGEPLELSPPSL